MSFAFTNICTSNLKLWLFIWSSCSMIFSIVACSLWWAMLVRPHLLHVFIVLVCHLESLSRLCLVPITGCLCHSLFMSCVHINVIVVGAWVYRGKWARMLSWITYSLSLSLCYHYYTLLSINLPTLCSPLPFYLSCLHLTKAILQQSSLEFPYLYSSPGLCQTMGWVDKQWVATWAIHLRKVMECSGFGQKVLDFGNL